MNVNPLGDLNIGALATTEGPTVEQAAQARQIAQAVRQINGSSAMPEDRELSMLLDPKTKMPIVRVIDSRTREIVNQIPAEYIVRIAGFLQAQEASQNRIQKLQL
jgi:uncharacterized FlaG/YvyC family protein